MHDNCEESKGTYHNPKDTKGYRVCYGAIWCKPRSNKTIQNGKQEVIGQSKNSMSGSKFMLGLDGQYTPSCCKTVSMRNPSKPIRKKTAKTAPILLRMIILQLIFSFRFDSTPIYISHSGCKVAGFAWNIFQQPNGWR